jgi:hypothetical protein
VIVNNFKNPNPTAKKKKLKKIKIKMIQREVQPSKCTIHEFPKTRIKILKEMKNRDQVLEEFQCDQHLLLASLKTELATQKR